MSPRTCSAYGSHNMSRSETDGFEKYYEIEYLKVI